MKKLFYSLLAVVLAACGSEKQAPIDREALVARNNPQVSSFDSLASLSVGNGEFAFTVDATGLQTFPSASRPLRAQAADCPCPLQDCWRKLSDNRRISAWSRWP